MKDPNRFARIRDLFDRCVDLDDGERERLLQSQSPALREEVIALVSASKTAPPFLEAPARDSEPGDDPVEEDLVGARLGEWKLLERISSGGMGDVYRGRGASGDVAIKVVRPQFASGEFLARFAAERDVLASLDHPNIVGFLEAGQDPKGRPYLVMEYVDGLTPRKFAQEHGLGISEVLRMFIRICAAVEVAHQQLVVHRDLKPSNILINSEGEPKLLDFGIAKLLSVGDEITQTLWPAPLTPAYASPEQLSRGRISTATDIYSLGAILHDLLCGHPPVEGQPAGSSNLPRPVAAILKKALRAEPRQRYSSVGALREDLEAWLEQRPVSALPDSLGYRVGSLMKRFRWATAAALILVAGLGAAALGAEWQRQAASREASRGWGAHIQAKMALHLVEEALVGTSTQGPEAALLEAESMLAEFTDRPEAEGLARISLGRWCAAMGMHERAVAELERAVELCEDTQELGPRDAERARQALVEARRRQPPVDD